MKKEYYAPQLDVLRFQTIDALTSTVSDIVFGDEEEVDSWD